MTSTLFDMGSSAIFSPCRTWRYVLKRSWDDGGIRREPAVFIGLNPSTANETTDDPTIRRCVGFAKRWGCGGLVMLNLFAFRATDPVDMYQAADPVGLENDAWLDAETRGRIFVIAAWGNHGAYRNRDAEVARNIQGLRCLGTNANGSPKHPLYVRGDAQLVEWLPVKTEVK
jgi:hypothetical protein